MSFDGMKEEELVGGKIFDKIQTDERVTPDLRDCLYCTVTSRNPNGSITPQFYNIPLNSIASNLKQCPACKRIYILNGPEGIK